MKSRIESLFATVTGCTRSRVLLLLTVAALTLVPFRSSFGATGSVVSFGGAPVPAGLDDAISIAAGRNHELALRSNGTVVEWGAGWGVPAGLSNVVAIAAGGNRSLALRSDGTVVNWGEFAFDPSTFDTVVPPAGLTGVVAIDQGDPHSIVVKADGTVVSWGAVAASVPPGLSNVVSVTAGYMQSAALKNDGSVVMWGNNFGGAKNDVFGSRTDLMAVALSDRHVMALRNNGTVLDYFSGDSPPNVAPTGLSNVVAISCGAEQGLALIADGSVVGWNNPFLAAGVSHVDAIAAGDNLSLVLTRWPVITRHPQSPTVNEGASASFSVVAAGAGPLIYQWQKDGANISGATNTSFNIAAATPADFGDYRVIVSNSSGSVTSLVANLNINTAPFVTSQPKSQNIFVGARVLFTAGVQGGLPLSYRWRKDNANLSGQTNATLSITNAQTSDAGSYTLVITNNYGAVTSAVATVNVTAYTFTWSPPGTVVGLDGPMVPTGLTNAVAIASGGSYAMALRDDGTVVEWNTNRLPAGLTDVIAISASQDGLRALALRSDGTVVAGNTAPAPADLFGVVAIAAGTRNNLALKVDGTIVSWGSLVAPAGLSNVVAISAASYNVALKSDGTAVIWGTIDGFDFPVSPSALVGADDLVAIAAGDDGVVRGHVVALRSNGTVLDYFGGDHTPTNAAPAGLSDVVAIAAGEHLSLALKSDGTIVRWNAAPAPEGISNVTAIAAGGGASLLIVSENPPLPMLAAGLEGGQFTLSTPISVSGYTLETMTNLSQVSPPTGVSTNIITFGGVGGTSAGQNNAAAMQFFRLRKTD